MGESILTRKGGGVSTTIDGTDETKLFFINNTVNYGATAQSITTNNGFIYVGGQTLSGTNRGVTKFYEGNLALSGANLAASSTANYGGIIFSITTNNGFIFAGGTDNQTVQKFDESNLVRVGNTVSYGAWIRNVATNNGFIYAGGDELIGTNRGITKFHEGNLALNGANLAASSTVNFGGSIQTITINNGFIYAGGFTNQTIKKFYESNLAFVGNTAAYGGDVWSVTTNNGFIYVGGATNLTVKKFYESNLALVGNTANYGGAIYSITTNNGFIYVGGAALSATNRGVSKFYESNLALVGNTVNYGVGSVIESITTNNGFIYAVGAVNGRTHKHIESAPFTNSLNGQAYYLIKKED